MLKQYQLKDYRFSLIVLVTALSILGVLLIGSAQESVQNKQIWGIVLGLAAMLIASLVDYRYLLNWYWLIYIFNIFLLILVEIAGTKVNGSKRWLEIGFQFQPSELSKILLILFFAKFLMNHEEDLNTPKTLLKMIVLMAIPIWFIKEQPDLSTSVMIAIIYCVLLFVGGISYKLIASILAMVVPLAIIFISLVTQPDQQLLDNYQYKRIMAWLHPEEYINTEGYQQSNSIMAIGSGQLFGKGLDSNTISSVKNGNFISEPQTDFIFAVAGEELGFVGGCTIIILIALIVLQCIIIAIRSKDLAGRIICCGMAGLIGIQSFINISVATGLMPNTGIPLPFVSSGLTSLVSIYMGIGCVLNVGLQPKRYERGNFK